ncbi:hypothetical protein EMIHUDRAFT_99746 [Emiliania huxleyi CCMP1516]|nr:hypothetical protein EMIHUDRAFT_99746 [Emiliania huxleyi CCMP1516]EOD29326.1 hypothetical protein EMIHUDRAFT_99746 [Emiliania huxleyi CCMP1516]|eukprot:XP_005781755.1 hypothetical protein EMIHUDRAFT_99746 [Emiliania huxleyi CCMP1516]
MAAARRPHQPRFLASAAVVSAEALKIGVSVAILLREQVRGGEAALSVLWRQVVVDWRGTLALFPPALIYLVQNNLLYLAAAHLDAAAYQVLYQLKLLTAALFSVLLLGRRLSPRRWGALLVLFVGALPRCSAHGPVPCPHLESTHAAAAGVWTEARVKRTAHVSVAVRNVQLGLASLAAGACSVCWLDAEAVRQRGLFAGFTPLVWLVVLQVAAGGLIIGVVHKHADNIAKGFATSLSILLSSALSALLPSLRFSPSPRFLLGAVLVVAATAVYCLSTDAPSGERQRRER